MNTLQISVLMAASFVLGCIFGWLTRDARAQRDDDENNIR